MESVDSKYIYHVNLGRRFRGGGTGFASSQEVLFVLGQSCCLKAVE
jgi:hypothetical protein